jgi:hypothetical protein
MAIEPVWFRSNPDPAQTTSQVGAAGENDASQSIAIDMH